MYTIYNTLQRSAKSPESAIEKKIQQVHDTMIQPLIEEVK
jgi:hypothetical protein